jgi:hypothetical protein
MSDDTRVTRTITDFITQNGIEMAAKRIKRRIDLVGDDEWSKTASHWEIVFSRGTAELVTHYSMGSAHKGEPKIEDVLDCLANDASSIENSRRFEDWAEEFGYDTDSRRAERIYDACVKTANELKEFLSPYLYNILLNETERL